MIKYFSCFSGIGGFELGLEGLECVGFSEFDSYPESVYKKHFINQKNYGDITKIEAGSLPEFDMIVGGFPCQPFSVAGKRKGRDDERGNMFFEMLRIARERKTRFLLFENVKGLLSDNKGKTFFDMMTSLDEVGYHTTWCVLNSKHFGVAQSRERLFIVGVLREGSGGKIFSFGKGTNYFAQTDGEKTSKHCQSITAQGGMNMRGTFVNETNKIIQLNNPNHSNDRVYDPEGLSPTLNTMQGGMRQPFIALTEKRTEEAKRIRRETKGKDYSPRRGKYVDVRSDGLVGCITANQSNENLLTDFKSIRRLTPVECERLQGFPDNWTKYNRSGEEISDTKRYKMLGNAVTTNVILYIKNLMFDS